MRVWVFLMCALLASAPRAETLADVQRDIDRFLRDLESLTLELEVSRSDNPAFAGSILDRVNSMEQELRRLTGITERLDFRIRQINEQGRAEMRALEARICDLDANCTSANMIRNPDLDDVDLFEEDDIDPVPDPALSPEQVAALDGIRIDLVDGKIDAVVMAVDAFAAQYPDSRLLADALIFKGAALAEKQDPEGAARAYLDAFVMNPDTASAPDALFGIATALADLGHSQQACALLGDLIAALPDSDVAGSANDQADALGCL